MTIFAVAILIMSFLMSVVLHEISHGYVAYILGDPTAKYAGRLTLNPLKHLDIFGSIILPFMLAVTNAGFIIGWAKPVPFNPYNLKNQKWGPALVGLSGPLANLFIVGVFASVVYLTKAAGCASISCLSPFPAIASFIVQINLALAVLNLIPIPPLDGSRLFSALLPFRWQRIMYVLERYSFVFVLIFIFFIWPYIFSPVVSFFFRSITGLTF